MKTCYPFFGYDGCVEELPTPCEGRGARFFEAISTTLRRTDNRPSSVAQEA